MSHSNAIDKAFDMLETGMVDGQADAQDKVRVQAKRALYEAVNFVLKDDEDKNAVKELFYGN